MFLTAIVALSIIKIGDSDVWCHLASGKWILESRAIPHVDIFSYTAQGRPWVDTPWLFQIIVYLLYSSFGINGLILFVAIVVLSSFAFLLLATQANKSNFYIAIAILFLGALAVRARFVPRPHIFTYLFLSIFSYLIALYRYRGKKKALFILPFIQLLWSSMHSGAGFGVLILGMYALFEWIKNRSVPKELLLSFILVTIAAFINPFTYKALFYGIFTISDPIFKKYIIELRHATLDSFLKPYGAFFLIGALSFLWGWKRRSWELVDLTLFIGFGAASIWTVRMQSEFAYITMPILARNLSRDRFRFGSRTVPVLLAGSMLWGTLFTVTERGKWAQFGFGVSEYALPVKAVEFIKRNDLKGKMFNQMWFGDYFTWHLYPERKVFIDGRTDVYGPKLLYKEVMYSEPEVWDAMDKEFDFDYAVLWNAGLFKKYPSEYLDSLKNWRLVYWDDASLVYIKDNGNNKNVIDKHTYKYIFAGNSDMSYLNAAAENKDAREGIIAELKRNIRDNPDCLLAHTALGYAYAKLGEYANAALELQEAIRIAPYQHELYARLGLAYQRAMKYDEAEAAYKKAIRLNPKDAEVHNNLGVLLYMKHDAKGAIRHWKKALRLDPANEGIRLNLKTIRID